MSQKNAQLRKMNTVDEQNLIYKSPISGTIHKTVHSSKFPLGDGRQRTNSEQDNSNYQRIQILKGEQQSVNKKATDISPYRIIQIVNEQVGVKNNQVKPPLVKNQLSNMVYNKNSLTDNKELVNKENTLNNKPDCLTDNQEVLKESRVQEQVVQCEICLCIISNQEKITIKKCSHQIHINCMLNYLKEKEVNLKCPQKQCQNYFKLIQLEGVIDQFQLNLFKQIMHFKETRQLFLSTYDQLSLCPKFNCSFYFVLLPKDPEFQCPSCRSIICLDCFSDLKNTQFVRHKCQKKELKQMHFKFCPKCGQKNNIRKEQLNEFGVALSCSNCSTQYKICF